VAELDAIAKTLSGILQDGDVVLTLGAGSIGAIAAMLPDALQLEFANSQSPDTRSADEQAAEIGHV